MSEPTTGPEEAERDDEHEAGVSRRRPCIRGKQKRLAGEGHACAFDEDAESRRGITERVHDRGRIHWQSPLPAGERVGERGGSSLKQFPLPSGGRGGEPGGGGGGGGGWGGKTHAPPAPGGGGGGGGAWGAVSSRSYTDGLMADYGDH